MRHLLLASRNAHKTREFRQMLGPDFSVSDLSRHPEISEVEETGNSFEENARLKASAVSEKIPGLIVADDSGLEVDSLGGKPGVRSARYAGEAAGDVANRAKLLQALAALPLSVSRQARFRCVLVLAMAGKMIATFEGVVEGRIARQEEGSAGFGYDPIFLPNELSRTFAQLSAEQKNSISHRGIAVAQLRAFLETCQLGG
ncbi:MAG TPA: RdgB/HAM1 family non-canonical purine NTP pyrophosphatase [Chthoniobacterales bacterium]|jgi:XTP/dITP diphosphohydrolase